MYAEILHFLFCVLIATALLSGQSSGQSRTEGKAREPGHTTEAAPQSPRPPSEDVSRNIGRSRPVETPVPPAPGPSQRGSRSEQPPSPPPPSTPAPQEHHPHHPDGHAPGVDANVTIDAAGTDEVLLPAGEGSSGTWIRDGIMFGRDITLSSLTSLPEFAGFDFSGPGKRSFDHPSTDICVEVDNDDLMMSVWEDSEIMDIGPANVPYDVIYVPRQEWSAGRKVLLVAGHEYVVRTWDHHYAKFFVTNVEEDRVTFDYAYQFAGAVQPTLTVRAVTRLPH